MSNKQNNQEVDCKENIGGDNHMEPMKGQQELTAKDQVAIKEAIADKVMTYDHVSFVEVQKIFDSHNFDYNGNRMLCHPEYPNLVFWTGWNDAAVEIIGQVLDEFQICMTTTSELIYLIDGGGLNLPVAKNMKSYRKARWYPVVLRSDKDYHVN